MPNLWLLLTPFQKRLFYALVVINLVAAGTEVLGVFSVLPFLKIASDPSAALAQPALRTIYDFCGFTHELQFVAAAGAATILAIVLSSAIAIGSLWFRTWYCNHVATEISDRLFRGYLTQPYEFFLSHNSSVLGKDLLNETNNFFSYALEPLTILLARGLQIGAMTLALLWFDWRSTIMAAILFACFYGIIFRAMAGRIKHFGAIRYATNEMRYRLACEALVGMKEVKLFGRESWYATHFERDSQRMVTAQGRVAMYSQAPRFALEVLVFSAVVGAVLSSLSSGRSVSDVMPTLGIFAVAGLKLLPSVQLVFQYAAVLTASAVAIRKLHDLFETVGVLGSRPNISSQTVGAMPFQRRISIDQINFSYASTTRRILDNLSLEIRAGDCVGICGPSGSGKTTLMDVLLGLLKPSSGIVTIDDLVLDEHNACRWQRNVGYVPQSIFLIDGTIAENIAFSTDPQSIDMDAVHQAAHLANLDDVIAASPAGINTVVGERGVRLSGGQRQRIAIARALYRNPAVLVFDEATSALDAASEAKVVEAIQAIAHTRTIIVVAHRLSTLCYCDVIYELRDGKIARSFTYEELAQSSPTHRAPA